MKSISSLLLLASLAILSYSLGRCTGGSGGEVTMRELELRSRLDSLAQALDSVEQERRGLKVELQRLEKQKEAASRRDSLLSQRRDEIVATVADEECRETIQEVTKVDELRLAARDSIIVSQEAVIQSLVSLVEAQRALLFSSEHVQKQQQGEIEYWKKKANPGPVKRALGSLPAVALGVILTLILSR